MNWLQKQCRSTVELSKVLFPARRVVEVITENIKWRRAPLILLHSRGRHVSWANIHSPTGSNEVRRKVLFPKFQHHLFSIFQMRWLLYEQGRQKVVEKESMCHVEVYYYTPVFVWRGRGCTTELVFNVCRGCVWFLENVIPGFDKLITKYKLI